MISVNFLITLIFNLFFFNLLLLLLSFWLNKYRLRHILKICFAFFIKKGIFSDVIFAVYDTISIFFRNELKYSELNIVNTSKFVKFFTQYEDFLKRKYRERFSRDEKVNRFIIIIKIIIIIILTCKSFLKNDLKTHVFIRILCRWTILTINFNVL